MQLGISTASYFNKLPVEDAVTDIARHGVPLCETFLNTYCEYVPSFVEGLAARAHENELRVYSVHPMSTQFEPQLFSLLDRQREDALRIFDTILQDGQLLGASYYVMHGPAHLSGVAKNLNLARIAPIFAELAARAAGRGLTLTLENVSWCVFCRPDFGQALASLLPPGTMKYTLDVKQALRAGYDPLEFVDAVGDDIVNVHLCDAIRQPDGRILLKMPGKGEYDFKKLFSALHAHGYTGPAFIEVYSDMYADVSELYESLAWLDTLLNSSPAHTG